MRYLWVIKIVRRLKSLTKKEKRRILVKAAVEQIVNSYKTLIKLPFVVIGLLFCTLEMIFGVLEEVFSFLDGIFREICCKIENKLPDFVITKDDEVRVKILKEIKERGKMSKFIEIGDSLVNLDEIRAIQIETTTQTIILTTGQMTELENPVVKIIFKDGATIERYGGTKKTTKELKRAYKKAKEYLLKEESGE